MFTGLIEEVGAVQDVDKSGSDWTLAVTSTLDLSTVRLGDSIAVNGACLTVVKKDRTLFRVEVSAETVRSTTFRDLGPGMAVNLERALRADARLDGHIVQGHVDAVGRVDRVEPRGRSLSAWFRISADAGRYVASKGSIALDGVSLTVNEVQDVDAETRFSVNLISHTQNKTTLARVRPGLRVNVETDVVGRYVERLLKRTPACPPQKKQGGLDEAFLKENGFA